MYRQLYPFIKTILANEEEKSQGRGHPCLGEVTFRWVSRLDWPGLDRPGLDPFERCSEGVFLT